VDVHVDAAGEDRLAARVDLGRRLDLAADLRDPAVADAEVGREERVGGDDLAAADREVKRCGRDGSCLPS
jgi:hypothetical protein